MTAECEFHFRGEIRVQVLMSKWLLKTFNVYESVFLVLQLLSKMGFRQFVHWTQDEKRVVEIQTAIIDT